MLAPEANCGSGGEMRGGKKEGKEALSDSDRDRAFLPKLTLL